MSKNGLPDLKGWLQTVLVVSTLMLLMLVNLTDCIVDGDTTKVSHRYTFRPHNMILLLHNDGRLSSYDLASRQHLWTSRSLGGKIIDIESHYDMEKESLKYDPFSMPFLIKGTGLYTHIPFRADNHSTPANTSTNRTRQERLSGGAEELKAYFFLNLSTLLRRQSVRYLQTDIFATTSVSFVDLNALNGDVLSYKSSDKSHHVSVVNSSFYKKYREMIPIVRVTRYDITIGAYKAGEYEWTLTVSRFVLAEKQRSQFNDRGEEKPPRFFSHFMSELFASEEEETKNSTTFVGNSKELVDPRRTWSENADTLEKTLFLRVEKRSFGLFHRFFKSPLAVFNTTLQNASSVVHHGYLILDGCDRVVVVPSMNSAFLETYQKLLPYNGENYPVANLPNSPYEEGLWEYDLWAEEVEDRLFNNMMKNASNSAVFWLPWGIVVAVGIHLVGLIISIALVSAGTMWRGSLLTAWKQSERNRSAYMARSISTHPSTQLGPSLANFPVEYIPLSTLPSSSLVLELERNKDPRRTSLDSLSHRSSTFFDNFESVSVHRIPSKFSITSEEKDPESGTHWWHQRITSATTDDVESVLSNAGTGNKLSDVRLFQLHFKIIEKIGFGGEGSVFCVEDRVTHSKHALKIVHLSGKDETRLTNEAVLHSGFDHPNIVRFFFCWVEEVSVADAKRLQILDGDDGLDTISYFESSFNQTSANTSADMSASVGERSLGFGRSTYRMLFIQMEYFSRGTLADLLRDRDTVHRLTNLRYIKDIAEGIAYLHGRQVVHRDIKPTNIFVSENGSLKVGDFGLAEAPSRSNNTGGEGSVSDIEDSMIIGSPLYCSPEQGEGKHVDKPSDVFSLGIIAVELYCSFQTMHERIHVLTDAKHQVLPEELPTDQEEFKLFIAMLSASPSDRPDIQKVVRQLTKLIIKLEEQQEEEEEAEAVSATKDRNASSTRFSPTGKSEFRNGKMDSVNQLQSSTKVTSSTASQEPYGPVKPPIPLADEKTELTAIVADEILKHSSPACLEAHFYQPPVM